MDATFAMYAVRFTTGDVLHVFADSAGEALRLAREEFTRLHGQGELPVIQHFAKQQPARMEPEP